MVSALGMYEDADHERKALKRQFIEMGCEFCMNLKHLYFYIKIIYCIVIITSLELKANLINSKINQPINKQTNKKGYHSSFI